MFRALLFILTLWAATTPLHAQSFTWATEQPVRLCPAIEGRSEPPDFTGPNCRPTSFWDIDPRGREIWVEARFTLAPDFGASQSPLGVHVSGMASSEVYVNGVKVGANGRPGPTRDAETPGRMDAIVYTPAAILQAGENRIVLHMSGHYGLFELASPMHVLGLGEYGPPTARRLEAYWPSLIMLSVFALGVIVFSVLALRGRDREGPAILALLSLFLFLQLLAEASRGLIAYPYPTHEYRLMAILASAYGVALCLIAHVLKRCFFDWGGRRRWTLLALTAPIAATPMLLVQAFDPKTGYVLLVALVLSAAGSGFMALKRRRDAGVYLIGMIATIVVLMTHPLDFLDRYLYWISASFLLILFVQQALALTHERRARELESERANRLDAALAQAVQTARPASLKLVSAGRTELVPTDQILSLSGAGDYVELRFTSGRTALHNATLSALEEALPTTFLRVHRSCIVNTAFVESLEREAGGGGRLKLTGGREAPVSRRVMPKVRSALETGAA